MVCPECENIVERPDVPHVVRTCKACGRELRMREPGENGKGIRIEKGDNFVIPAGWLNLSFNPLKSSGRFSRHGLAWFAKMILLDELPKRKDEIGEELQRLAQQSEEILKASKILEGLDLENITDAEKAISRLKEQQDSLDFWTFQHGFFINVVQGAIEKQDTELAVWAMGCAERCRSMCVFKEHLEEVVWMGQSAKRIVDALRIWDGNKENSNESFWQSTLSENVYAISQVFAVPLVFIKDSAYVGGVNIDRQDAKLVDYLFSLESSREAVLVEIKTPTTKLLGSKYRGIVRPSSELVGATTQVLDYRNSLVKNLATITDGTGYDISAFSPRCVVIVGNGSAQLADENRRRSFELFRSNSKDVEIVTYDELFRKLEVLASLFSLARSKVK